MNCFDDPSHFSLYFLTRFSLIGKSALTSEASSAVEYFTGRPYGTNLFLNEIMHPYYLVPCPADHLSC